MNVELQDKLILVTGAGQGIGSRVALAVAAQGARVVVHYRHSKDAAAETAAAIEANGGQAHTAYANLAEYDSVVALGQQLDSFSQPLYGVVNNAGFGQYKSLFQYKPFEWQSEIDTCLLGVLHLAYVLLPTMKATGGGKFINFVGESARIGDKNLIISAAARGGAVSFVKSLAQEVGPDQIQCNTLSLGLIDKREGVNVDANADADADADRWQKIRRQYPLRRLGTPDDVADAVLFLLSHRSNWITGQVLPVNGGFSMIG